MADAADETWDWTGVRVEEAAVPSACRAAHHMVRNQAADPDADRDEGPFADGAVVVAAGSCRNQPADQVADDVASLVPAAAGSCAAWVPFLAAAAAVAADSWIPFVAEAAAADHPADRAERVAGHPDAVAGGIDRAVSFGAAPVPYADRAAACRTGAASAAAVGQAVVWSAGSAAGQPADRVEPADPSLRIAAVAAAPAHILPQDSCPVVVREGERRSEKRCKRETVGRERIGAMAAA